MQSLDQNETAFVGPNENGGLLSDFQDASRDLFNDLRLDCLLPFHGNVNLGDWEAFRFGHSLYSVVTGPSEAHAGGNEILRTTRSAAKGIPGARVTRR